MPAVIQELYEYKLFKFKYLGTSKLLQMLLVASLLQQNCYTSVKKLFKTIAYISLLLYKHFVAKYLFLNVLEVL